MARTIAVIGGIALKPGVSRNRRWYKPEHITGAVARAQARLAEGERPMVMLSAHPEGVAQSREIAARLTGISLSDDGTARFRAAIADTAAGRDIASLADISDGEPAHLEGVSIRGHWLGKVRKVTAPDGDVAETGEGLEIDGLDFTPSPGVNGAKVTTFSWAGSSDQMETDERVAITESVQEALVTTTAFTETAEADGGITEQEPQIPATVREAMQALLGEEPHILENGLCITCADVAEARVPLSKRGSGLKGTGGPYADPGYQSDKKQRYQLDTKAHAKAAWAYINQAGNAKAYTAQQLKRIKDKIMAALKRFGVSVSKTASESAGWTFDAPVRIDEAVIAEWVSPEDEARRSGSWSINASNGPVSMYMQSYCMDPGDLDVILRAAANAACLALKALDPDMDGDVDVPGVGDNGDPDDDSKAESAPADAPTEDSASNPAAATQEGGSAVSGTTTTEAAGQAPAAESTALDPAAIAEAAVAKYEAERKARKEAKAAKAAKKARKAEEAAAKAPVTETAEETAVERAARIRKLVAEGVAAGVKNMLAEAGVPAEPAVQESDEQMVARLVAEGLTKAKQELVESGKVQPGRTGLTAGGAVNEHSAARAAGEVNSHGMPANWPDKPLTEFSDEEFTTYAGRALDHYVMKGRAVPDAT